MQRIYPESKLPSAVKGGQEKKELSHAVELDYSIFLKVFFTEKNTFLELHRYNPLTISKQRVVEWRRRFIKEVEIEQQKYIPERHEILGSDLATAHFIVYRGGRVKFEANGDWISKSDETDPSLPNTYVRNMYLHSIDASNTTIRYEGLVNFTNLHRLKWLSFRNCPHVDDWFLDRISGEYADTLEYLDISDCEGITEFGLSCIFRMRYLRTLKVSNIAKTRTFEYMCLLLEENMPNLSVEGVQYMLASSVKNE